MRRPFPYSLVVFAGLVVAAAASGPTHAAKPQAPAKSDKEAAARIAKDLAFASEMARKGLWREALFRWERVLSQRPEDAHLLNNVAVAREALGDREGARQAYERALQLTTERQVEDNVAYFRRGDPPPEPEPPGEGASESSEDAPPVTPPPSTSASDPAADGRGRHP